MAGIASMFEGTGGPANTPRSVAVEPLTKVAAEWVKRKGKSEQLKQYHENDWLRYWRWYLNWVQALVDPQDWWRSNAPDPEPFKVIETLLPKHVLGQFSAQEWFTIKGRERSDAEYARMVQSLLVYMTERQNIFPKFYECIKYALIMGHAWGKMTWRIDQEDRVRTVGEAQVDESTGAITGVRSRRLTEPHEVYNDPWFEWLMLDKIWPDPSGQGRWYVERIDTTLAQLHEVQDQLGIYHNLSDVETHLGARQERFDETRDGLGIESSITFPDEDHVVLDQCWGWIKPSLRGKDGNAWRLTVIANGLIEIRDEAIPTPDNRPPYFPIKSIPIPGRLYGESILHWIGPKCDQKSTLANMRLDEVKLGVWQQYVFDRDAVTSNQALFEPGGGLAIDTQGRSINDVFALLPRKPIMQEAYIEEGALKSTIEDAAAANPLQQGVADSSRQTATEIATLRNMGDQRFVLAAMWMDHTLKREYLSRGFKLYQQKMPEGRLIRILGKDYSVPVSLAQLQEDVDISVASGLEAFGREARIQSISEFIQLSSSDVFASWLKPDALLKQLAEDRGWRDIDRFVLTPEEHQQAQQAAQQMQVQMAQLQAMLEAQSKIAVESAKGQADIQAQHQKLQIESAKAQLDMAGKQADLQGKQAEMGMKLRGKQAELAMKSEGHRVALDAGKQKAGLDLMVAAAKARVQMRAARKGERGGAE